MGCVASKTPAATCDQTGKRLAFGDWHHRIGARMNGRLLEPSYDLCGEAFKKLTPVEQAAYVPINSKRDFRQVFRPAVVNAEGARSAEDVRRKRSSKAEDLSRPAEVPCAKCGASTYFQEGEARRRCFKCGEPLDRSGVGARGLESSKESKPRDVQRTLQNAAG